jgi:UDPglucose 6-dehydrogenase
MYTIVRTEKKAIYSTMKKQIVIAGYGYVGSAVGEALYNHYDVVASDPLLNENKVYDYPNAIGIILCLPTPQDTDGSCDVSYLATVLADCRYDTPILIKSTLSIEGYNYLKSSYPSLRITYSPEFLTAANAKEDFLNQTYYYLAGSDISFWASIFKVALPKSLLKPADSIEELILVKYFRNSFLSVKVAYANQMYDVCKALGISYSNVRSKFIEDTRIGSSHTTVPGPDGSRGFGGACFPKDTAAITYTANLYDWDLSVIQAAVDYNNKIKDNI